MGTFCLYSHRHSFRQMIDLSVFVSWHTVYATLLLGQLLSRLSIKLARQCIYSLPSLARSANLPEGLYILYIFSLCEIMLKFDKNAWILPNF